MKTVFFFVSLFVCDQNLSLFRVLRICYQKNVFIRTLQWNKNTWSDFRTSQWRVWHTPCSLSLSSFFCACSAFHYAFWLLPGHSSKPSNLVLKIYATMTLVKTNKTFTVVSKTLEVCLTDNGQLKIPTESLSRVIMQNRCWMSNRTHSHNSTLSHNKNVMKNCIIFSRYGWVITEHLEFRNV